MTDWTSISALATAGGTLVLALATFSSVRSGNRAALVTERALLARIRPVLLPSRHDDPPEKMGFGDEKWLKVEGGQAGVEVTADAIYLGIPLRNVGDGIAVLDRWDFHPQSAEGPEAYHRDPALFRRLTRDLYVPANDRGFWHGVLRAPDDPMFAMAHGALTEREPVTIDLLYGDHEGGQRTVSRFGLLPHGENKWTVAVSRHWNLDRDDPR